MVVGKDGRLYVGGDFITAGGQTVNYISVWNGSQWQSLGQGLNGAVYGLTFDSNNNLIVAGAFTATSTGNNPLTKGLAKWNGSLFLPMDIVTQVSVQYNIAKINPVTGTLVLGFFLSSSTNPSTATTITNNGSVGVYPTITFTSASSAQLFSIINNTTNTALYFSCVVTVGETVTLNTDPFNFSFTSSAFGDIKSKILPGSDIASFGLQPGANIISINADFGNYTVETVSFSWYNTHMSFLAGSQ